MKSSRISTSSTLLPRISAQPSFAIFRASSLCCFYYTIPAAFDNGPNRNAAKPVGKRADMLLEKICL